MNDQKGQLQDTEYAFPYHHIPQFEDGKFAVARVLDWGCWGCVYQSYIRYVAQEIKRMGCRSVLDVGCGDGRLAAEIGRCASVDHLLGIDISPRAINLARAMSPGVDFRCGDITQPCDFGRKFEAITLVDTLEHIPPQIMKAFVAGVAENLADDGRVLITVPSTNLPLQEKHYQHFDVAILQSAIEPSLKIESHGYLNKRGFLNGIIRRVVGNNWVLLNNPALLSRIYAIYEKHLLIGDSSNGTRVFAVARKNPH